MVWRKEELEEKLDVRNMDPNQRLRIMEEVKQKTGKGEAEFVCMRGRWRN